MKRPILILVLWLAALAGLIFLTARRTRSSKPLDRLWPVPAFEATAVTTKGVRALHETDLLGRPWVANLIFTSCGGPCPMMSAKMAALQRILPVEVRLVSFSVDPVHDTPAALQGYAGRFHADPERWLFVRCKKEALYKLVYSGFRLSVAERHGAPAETRILHSTHFVLVDAQGLVRGFYDANGPAFMENLAADAGRLVKERL